MPSWQGQDVQWFNFLPQDSTGQRQREVRLTIIRPVFDSQFHYLDTLFKFGTSVSINMWTLLYSCEGWWDDEHLFWGFLNCKHDYFYGRPWLCFFHVGLPGRPSTATPLKDFEGGYFVRRAGWSGRLLFDDGPFGRLRMQCAGGSPRRWSHYY